MTLEEATFLKDMEELAEKSQLTTAADMHQAYQERLVIPDNIEITFIPAYTPEMNPIEQVWKEIRWMGGFANKAFHTFSEVIDQLAKVVNRLTKSQIQSIVSRDWI